MAHNKYISNITLLVFEVEVLKPILGITDMLRWVCASKSHRNVEFSCFGRILGFG